MKTRKGYSLRPLGKEYILVADGLEAVDFSRMVSMNESAALLWEAVEGKDFDAGTLADLLVDNYGIDRERAEKDVSVLLETWRKASIIEV